MTWPRASRPERVLRVAASLLCFVVLVSIVLIGENGRQVSDTTLSGQSIADHYGSQLDFSILGLNLSGFSISLAFTSNLTLSGGPVQQGQNVTATASLTAPTTANLTIGYLGQNVSLPINPLGVLYEVPIPGLTYGYEGIASLGLYLNFSGTILGNSSFVGPASAPSGTISWNGSSTDTIPLSVWSNATDGSSIFWSVTNISYGLSVGIDASGSLLGYTITLPLVNFGSVGLFVSTPSTVFAYYTLPASTSGAGGSALGPASSEALGIAIAAVVLIVAVGLAVAFYFRRKSRQAPPIAPHPPASQM